MALTRKCALAHRFTLEPHLRNPVLMASSHMTSEEQSLTVLVSLVASE